MIHTLYTLVKSMEVNKGTRSSPRGSAARGSFGIRIARGPERSLGCASSEPSGDPCDLDNGRFRDSTGLPTRSPLAHPVIIVQVLDRLPTPRGR